MMETARSLGFAARFVTGYIYVPTRDGPLRLGGGSTHACRHRTIGLATGSDHLRAWALSSFFGHFAE
jgi:hypothetical protein